MDLVVSCTSVCSPSRRIWSSSPRPSEAALDKLLTAATEQSAVSRQPRHQGTALLRHAGQSRGVQVVGAPESGLRDVIDLESHITFGDLQALEREPFSIILGADLARLLRVRPGDNVDILLPRLTVSPMGVFPKSRSLRVVGTFAVGAPPDARVAYVAEVTARKLLGPAGMQGIQLRLSDRELVSLVSAAIRPRVDASTQIRDWRSSQGSLFAAIKMEKVTVGILLTSVILVAAFNLISTLTMSVTEKRGDIAILQVLGLPAKKLLMLFWGTGFCWRYWVSRSERLQAWRWRPRSLICPCGWSRRLVWCCLIPPCITSAVCRPCYCGGM